MEQQPFIITIVGAESSGKTTLASQLAEFYGCPWVPEYARENLEAIDRPYLLEDLYVIAAVQLERIRIAIKDVVSVGSPRSAVFSGQSTVFSQQNELYSGLGSSNQVPELIIDGGMLTMRMWAQIKYGVKIPIVEEALQDDVTSCYLLCRPLNDWEPDPLREAPNLLDRAWIYNQYLKELVECEFPFQIVPSGKT